MNFAIYKWIVIITANKENIENFVMRITAEKEKRVLTRNDSILIKN